MSGAAIASDMTARVTGAARGASDVVLPGMLQGRILTSPHPHAVIRRIDVSKAHSLPGVAVLTHADCPMSDGARPLLAGTACFEGDWIAAVAAENPFAAEDALNLIDIDFDILPAHTDPLRQENDTSVLPDSNQPGDGSHEVNFSGIASRSLRTDFAQQAAVANFDSSGKPTIEAATTGNDTASRLCDLAILLAKRSGRPVKLVEPEGVDLYARRSASLHKVRLRAGADGRLTSAEHEAVVDAGAYPLAPLLAEGNMSTLAGALAFSAARSRVSKIRTNTRPKDRAFPGNEEGSLIFQQALDMMAEKTGLDPIEFRSRNRLPGDDGRRMEDCLRAGAMRFGWSRKWRGWKSHATASDRYRQGVGLSILSRGKTGALFAHQADFVEVEVDIETGATVLLSHVCALDITGLPKAPDPTKLQAAFVAGIGDALLEEAAPASWVLAPFRAPSIMDTLDVDCIFTGSLAPSDTAPLPGSDEAGFANLAPAIANAVYDAAGIRLCELPLSPERVLRSLREKSTTGSSNAGKRVS